MRKKLIKMFIILLMLILVNLDSYKVFAEVPYKTTTQGPNGKIVNTQTAYEPLKTFIFPINNPEDIYIDKLTNVMYIADTGNSRILLIQDEKVVKVIGENILQKPSGIFVSSDNNIYVADYGRKKVFIFNKEGKVIKEIGKPNEPIYGKNNDFIPKKLVVGKRGDIYVISEGSINGVVQLNNEGRFAGYYGTNKTEMSLNMILQKLFFTSKQKAQLFKKTPPSPTNIAIDDQGLVYTSTNGIKNEAIKKLNIMGINILTSNTEFSNSLVDIDVDVDGNIYGIDNNGLIYVYNSYGDLLFSFGGKDSEQERIGLLKNPVAISVNKDGYLYVADKERNVVVIYKPTQFAKQVLMGVNLYKQGLYTQSQEIWKDILKMNSSFILSYRALAKAYFKQENYDMALKDFKLAEDQKGYSDAFWQIRNLWLQENTPKVILLIIFILVLKFIFKKLDKKYRLFNKPREIIKKFNSIKLIQELAFAFRFFKHPIDSYYELKRRGRASILSATILYIWLLIIQIISIFITGFVFSKTKISQVEFSTVIISTYVPLILWVVANYLVSTINDGEGRLKDVYIGTIYSLTPYLVIILPVQILSNGLTLNESFIYNFSLLIAKTWSAILLVMMVKEIHNYTIKETIKNIFLTIFTMILIVLILFIVVILFNQEIEFIKSIIQELRIRV